MRTIRTVAVGLLIAGCLMVTAGKEFFLLWYREIDLHNFAVVVGAMGAPFPAYTESVSAVSGMVFVCICVGAGLLASAFLYAPIDRYLSNQMARVLGLGSSIASATGTHRSFAEHSAGFVSD